MWERRHGSVGHLSRLPDCWSGDHDWDRAVDRSLLFADRQPADIAVLVLRDVLVGLARRGPHHRAEGGDKGSAVSRLERDELSLNRLLIPFVPAEAGTQFFGRVLGSWVPASAGTNGDWFNGGANLNSSRSTSTASQMPRVWAWRAWQMEDVRSCVCS